MYSINTCSLRCTERNSERFECDFACILMLQLFSAMRCTETYSNYTEHSAIKCETIRNHTKPANQPECTIKPMPIQKINTHVVDAILGTR